MSDMIKWCDLWERQRRGNDPGVYLAGAVGGLKLLLFRRHNPDPDGPHWTLFVAPRTPQQDSRDAPTRGKQSYQAARELAETFTPEEIDR